MPTRLRNTIALLTLFAAVAVLGPWSLGDHAADTPVPGGSLIDAFPTAEAGFALQRPAPESR